MRALITTEPIASADLARQFCHPECGALCTFEGMVRNHHMDRRVEKIIYEAYVPMAVKELQRLKDEIRNAWPDCHVEAVHRIGELKIGEVAVAICAWAPHRQEAFEACRALIDGIKGRLPVWKKEFYVDGVDSWVSCSEHHQGARVC